MDNTARDFHAVILQDLLAKNDTGLPSDVVATLITDINRIARAGERQALALEQMALVIPAA